MQVWSKLPDRLHGQPVAARPWPLLGHQASMALSPVPFLQRQAELGPFCWLDMGFGVGWALFGLDTDAYKALRAKTMSVSHYEQLSPVLLGRSLLTRDGAEHRSMRNAMNAPFTPKGLHAAGVCEIVDDVVHERVEHLAAQDTFVALEHTRELALDIIFRILGIDTADLPAWRSHYEDVLLSTLPVRLDFPGSPHRRARLGREWVAARLAERVRVVREDDSVTGLLADMVRGWDASGQDDDDVLVDNVLLLALAGHETTASTMAWMTAHLAEHPEVWDRLVEEATSVGARPRDPKALAAHPYAEAVFRECLRLYPPVPNVSRVVTEEMEISGVTIAPGVHVNVPIVLYGRDATHYPDPDTFRPERWMSRERRPSPLETLAFSYGPHFCLGYHVALAEGIQYAVALARSFAARGRRPRLTRGFPKATWLGLCHPRKRQTRVAVA